ncbi:hypothetical protein RhiirB3_417966 [Rhizophagus irregularis]|nr:hypothetical protein RhiirB3_417966 [Rhizophagus irregularis]
MKDDTGIILLLLLLLHYYYVLRNRQRQSSQSQPPTINYQSTRQIEQNKPFTNLILIILVIFIASYVTYQFALFRPEPIPSLLDIDIIDAPAILLIGKTGAGKSTLGNLLLKTSEFENPTFPVSSSFSSVTKQSGFATIQIDNKTYNVIDTPGIFDTDNPNEVTLEEIARTIRKCSYGIKAILFVIEAKRFTIEQKEMVNKIKLLLGDEALQYMITVFSFCDKKQTENLENFKKSSWNKEIKTFVNSMGNRWAISPNSDIFPPDNRVHQQRLRELWNHIFSIDGVYTNELLKKARKKQEENARIAKEAKEKRKREYDESRRKEGEVNALVNYKRQGAEDLRKAKERQKEEIEDIVKSLLKKIEELEKRVDELSGGCFELETQVKLESGRIIKMSELQTGDRVLSNVRNGIDEYSEVYLIAHIGKLEHEEKFAKVNFTRPDGSKGQLRLTTTHYVFDENLSIIFAKDLRPGESKILVSDDNNKLVSVFVDDVTIELHDEYISFYTRAGSVIANGVLCSCYDQCPRSQTLMDLIFLPVRLWTYIIPSTHREERLHPYVQFLETVYLLFINSMGKGKRLIGN